LEGAHEQIIRHGAVLSAVLTGSHATRQRHVRQAKIIQAEIAERWQRETPWTWQKKHMDWFLDHRLAGHSESTKYSYTLTARLLSRRLKQSWTFKRRAKINYPTNRTHY